MELINRPSHIEKVFYCKNPGKTDNERRIKMGITAADIENVLKVVVSLVGGGVALYGVIEALSGYSQQASGKMSDGIMKIVGGVGIIIIGAMLIPKMFQGIAI